MDAKDDKYTSLLKEQIATLTDIWNSNPTIKRHKS